MVNDTVIALSVAVPEGPSQAGQMSAFAPNADIDRQLWNVRYVPIADIEHRLYAAKRAWREDA
jgi:hypothetical protein